MNLITPTRRLRRSEASKYLKEVHGIDRAPSTLAKLATIGGGPKFEKANRIPLYAPKFLDEFARSILSPPMTSTSDFGIEESKSMAASVRKPPAAGRRAADLFKSGDGSITDGGRQLFRSARL